MLGTLYAGPATLQGQGSDYAAKGLVGAQRQDEQRPRELSRLRSGVRTPRRSQTHHDYQLPPPPPTVTIHNLRQQPHHLQSTEPVPTSAYRHSPLSSSTPRIPEQHQLVTAPKAAPQQQPRPPAERRPLLPPPRRSYSVMDYEPMPHHHRPSTRGMTLLDLPSEIRYAIFDFLDPIDSTCLGLVSQDLYAIHRRLHGRVPLSARRDGPNELEWAWHFAGAPSAKKQAPADARAGSEKEGVTLSKLRVRGQAYCRKCGICRCELHRHIKDWMGENLEYCSVRQKFGPVAPEGAKPFCYRNMPKDPRRCGRHRRTKSKVVLQ